MKKILLNTFALIGFVTFILLACSVDELDSPDNNNNNSEVVSNGYGKYQVASTHTSYIVVLNTETDVMKSYYRYGTGDDEYWGEHMSQITFTH